MMELKYVVLTIIKILISVPAVIYHNGLMVEGAALMGGHFDNNSTINNGGIGLNNTLALNNSSDLASTLLKDSSVDQHSEEIPDPSPLVLPGYNLPENIFNKGKPFYLEKDPLTGQVDFEGKSSSLLRVNDDLYEYDDDTSGLDGEHEPTNYDIYNKANIDRKDGALHSHKPSDVNQLTPNFHDFLNLPIKYNSDKYVYPLISSSYANTKIQGNVNKIHNHKDYNVIKSSTVGNPTYYSTTKSYYHPTTKPTIVSTKPTMTTTTTTTTTEIYLTSKVPNLMHTGMGHPSFNEDFEYYDSTEKPSSEVYLTTKNLDDIYLTTKVPPSSSTTTTTTTKRTMSLFEQLFGDYDDTVTTTESTQPVIKIETTQKPVSTTPGYHHFPNSHTGGGSMTGNMGLDYEYDEYEEEKNDNVAVEDKVSKTNISTTPKTITVTSTSASTTVANRDNLEDSNSSEYSEYDYSEKREPISTKLSTVPVSTITSTEPSSTIKVTSLPLGENHVSSLSNRQPIIVATQNIREKLNNEKVVPTGFSYEKPPSTSNIHIAPDQDTVSFVVGHHQNVDGGQYVGTSLKESPYDSNPFRPFYGQGAASDTVAYTIDGPAEQFKPPPPPPIKQFPVPSLVPGTQPFPAGAVTIQPQKNSEASLAIGVPIDGKVPGQVVDEKLEINDSVEFPKGGSGTKVVFPDDKDVSLGNLVPPPPPPVPGSVPSREVLKLNSKPMYHQLPSDLTPPKEKEVIPQPLPPQPQPPAVPQMVPHRIDRPRPPWDPRPGHFFSGKPEYARPPRPDLTYKRIDNLPNILPQFRPNMKTNLPPLFLNRQPLLERPSSNRPIGFFEKLQPPPPPPPKNLHNLRKIPSQIPSQNLDQMSIAEDRIINEPPKGLQDQFNLYQMPPKVIANRRIGNLEGDVETLQMIQAKKGDRKEGPIAVIGPGEPITTDNHNQDGTEKPVYVVYPVNTSPIKMDVIDNKKETVVIGTRAELPLPPSKINQDFNYEQKDRNDAPILKPHPRPPSNYPIISDFPYPLERPDPSVLNPAVPETGLNNLDEPLVKGDAPGFLLGNQWNSVSDQAESRIVNGNDRNQISVTLKTYTERPIAVAYTPTETHDDKYSLPNYASPVIPEIRPGTVLDHPAKMDSEITLSAVMHTHPQLNQNNINKKPGRYPSSSASLSFAAQPPPPPPLPPVSIPTAEDNLNYKSDSSESSSIHQLDFQAPFQASVSVDSASQGWSVVKNNNKSSAAVEKLEVTTLPFATTSEFDIENFKPQLEGGFKPIYNYPQEQQQQNNNNNSRASEDLGGGSSESIERAE